MKLALFPVLFILTLSACGGPRAPGPEQIFAADFGDTRPTSWSGRRPDSYPVHGIDVARYQSGLDWDAARRDGVNFAFIKATEGGDRVDRMFKEHWDAAGRAGVARGAYHFYYFCTPAAVQAQWFIDNVPKRRGDLPPVLDLEQNHLSPTCPNPPAPEIVRREARIFIDMLTRHYGQAPIIYTTPRFYARNEMRKLSGEEFWLRSTADHPNKRYPDERWTFWQYSATGQVDGASGSIDLNAFSGTRAAWTAWRAARSLR